jgi:hypothetical protein
MKHELYESIVKLIAMGKLDLFEFSSPSGQGLETNVICKDVDSTLKEKLEDEMHDWFYESQMEATITRIYPELHNGELWFNILNSVSIIEMNEELKFYDFFEVTTIVAEYLPDNYILNYDNLQLSFTLNGRGDEFTLSHYELIFQEDSNLISLSNIESLSKSIMEYFHKICSHNLFRYSENPDYKLIMEENYPSQFLEEWVEILKISYLK